MKKLASGAVAMLFMGSVLMSGCQTVGDGDKTKKGGFLGAAGGALAGAAIGAATGNWKKGMLIGAAAGLAVGVTTGVVLDKQEEKLRKSGIRTERDEKGRLMVSLAGDALRFNTGSATLSDAGKRKLYQLAKIFVEYPENRIVIQGHTDSDGSEAANKQLSQARAQTVSNTLRGYKVPPKCILMVEGYGEAMPVASNATAAGKAANRRVDLIISADEEEAKKNQAYREKYRKN